jgi:L-2,4-diaminobutyrate transaminase
VTIAKGLTSGYVPMSACLISEEIFEVLQRGSEKIGPFSHGYTYSGHPVAAAAGLANLDLIQQADLVGNARSVGAYLQASLRESFEAHPLVGEVRGVGLIGAVELVADRAQRRGFDPALRIGARLAEGLLEEGLLCRPLGNALAFSPPLVIVESEVDEMLERFRRGLEKLATSLQAEGVWKPA